MPVRVPPNLARQGPGGTVRVADLAQVTPSRVTGLAPSGAENFRYE